MPARNPIRVAVVGATGYAGAELVRYLVRHPSVRLTVVTSEQRAGVPLAEAWPSTRGKVDLRLSAFDPVHVAAEADVAFTALPRGAAAPGVARLLSLGCRVIDIGPDYRLRDAEEYARWYEPHPHPELLADAVYGLTEYQRAALPQARLVANPGCYPTAALLALLPLLERGQIEPRGIVIDAKSGVTGAGRSSDAQYSFAEVDDNFRAYKVGVHRHAPEIEQALRPHAGDALGVLFVPHLLPTRRGILCTIYATPTAGVDGAAIAATYEARYGGERFVVLTGDQPPEIRDVRGTNDCAIGWIVDPRSGQLVVMSAIDNLGKGAAGQAVQNLNVVMGFPEASGLDHLAVVP